MHRFFSKQLDLSKKMIIISDPKEIHHVKNVLRLKRGDPLSVFDGKGKEAEGSIVNIKGSQIDIMVTKVFKETKKTKSVILACAIPRKAKFDSIIEKCTELGVDEIIPLKTKRTEVVLDANRAVRKIQRYQKIAISAAKQCKRRTIPTIHPITPFTEAIKSISKEDAAFIPCLVNKQKDLAQIKDNITPSTKRIIFFIGPEGDFTESEVDLAIKKGCTAVSLGETTLKVDTAAIVVVAFANLYLR